MKNLTKYERKFEDICDVLPFLTKKEVATKILKRETEKIKFLEGIYTSESGYIFSETFRDAAKHEAEGLRKLTSVAYEILRQENGVK